MKKIVITLIILISLNNPSSLFSKRSSLKSDNEWGPPIELVKDYGGDWIKHVYLFKQTSDNAL